MRGVRAAGATLAALALSGAASLPVEEFYPSELAAPGTKAVAKTVFAGDTIEEFPVEIIGRYRNFVGPGQDVILARLLGDRTAFTGVVAGMSGSPVYVGGKLLGAIAYRLGTFAKEPIAGITPIEDMIRAGETPAGARLAALDPGGAPEPAVSPGLAAPAAGLVPIETPLLLGGFPRGVVEAYAPRFRALGLEPVQAGASSGGAEPGAPMRPGSAIAAVLVRGDLSVAATGTLTYISGRKLYAFGHPFLQSGSVDIPAARASILWTLSSWMGSNKLASVGDAVGSIHEDRVTAIVGELGAVPRMIPVSVEVDAGRPSPRRYTFDIARARVLVPLLVNITVAACLAETLDYANEATVSMTSRIDVPGGPPIVLEDALAGDAASPLPAQAAERVAGVVERIYSNPFRDVDVSGITVKLKHVPKIRAAQVDRLILPSSEIKPGTPYEFRVHLVNYRNEPSVEKVGFTLPADALPGQAVLVVGEGRAVDAAVPQFSTTSRLVGARDWDSYVQRLAETPRGGRLYVRLVRGARGTTLGGEALPDLPPSVLSLLSSRRDGDRPPMMQGKIVWERVIEIEGPVSGLISLPLRIGRPALSTRGGQGS